MRKLPAFTLIELLIGMIITSIVIAFGYGAYSFIYKQYLEYKNVKATMMETAQLHNTLENDIQSAELISLNENKLAFFKGNKKRLTYDFYDDLIVRQEAEVTDTFHISPIGLKFKNLFPQSGMFVREFSFETILLDEKEYFHFVKNYSPEILMNYEPIIKLNQ